jgi:hypothetical protein
VIPAGVHLDWSKFGRHLPALPCQHTTNVHERIHYHTNSTCLTEKSCSPFALGVNKSLAFELAGLRF